MADLIRLTDDDWQHLLPERPYTLGAREIMLRPVTVDEIALCVKYAGGIKAAMAEAGIDRANVMARLPEVIAIVIDRFPAVLEILTGIHRDDLRRLPAGELLALANEVADINLFSREGLEKNFLALADGISRMMSGASETLPSSSSKEATRGGRSGPAPSDS